MNRRGQAFSSVVVLAGIATVATTAIVLRRPLAERWYLWQLESGGEREQRRAAEKLAELGSTAAVPALFEIYRRLEGLDYRRARFLDAETIVVDSFEPGTDTMAFTLMVEADAACFLEAICRIAITAPDETAQLFEALVEARRDATAEFLLGWLDRRRADRAALRCPKFLPLDEWFAQMGPVR